MTDDLTKRLTAQEILVPPGVAFTLTNIRPWLSENDALRHEAAAEIARLRAEVERLKVWKPTGYLTLDGKLAMELGPADYFAAVVHERDAALAREAALREAGQKWLDAEDAMDAACGLRGDLDDHYDGPTTAEWNALTANIGAGRKAMRVTLAAHPAPEPAGEGEGG